jgi:histidyl-tRNA synthetase
VEQQWLDHIRNVFESYGYCSIETPAVEELDVITAKGGDGGADVDKEVYVLERLHKEPGDKEARLALHFDQTVPLARYVAQHFNSLVFPFKRYQMQKVWRGERPQAGRFREFYQCDIDVINVDNLPLSFDAEMPAIIWEILSSLPGMEKEKIQLRVSNRKILIGLLESIETIKDISEVLKAIDKLEKIGEDETKELISKSLYDPDDIAEIDFIFSVIKNGPLAIPDEYLTDKVKEGIKEADQVVAFFRQSYPNNRDAIKLDLSIVRGLDYYTGTVYETVFLDDPGYGSICSGGRYDDLASSYINKKLPGVGISIGFSRLFAKLLAEKKQDGTPKLPVGPMSAADVMVILPSEEARETASNVARELRKNGNKVELYHSGKKSFGDQMKYASKKKIPFVWFPETSEVKNMATGAQTKADATTWKK